MHAAEHGIWIYPVAGGTAARLDQESTDQHGASWSPDGNWLAYRRLVEDQSELAVWDVASGTRSRLVALPSAVSAEVEGMALSTDESRVILGAGTPTSDIWLLEDFDPPATLWSRWFRR